MCKTKKKKKKKNFLQKDKPKNMLDRKLIRNISNLMATGVCNSKQKMN